MAHKFGTNSILSTIVIAGLFNTAAFGLTDYDKFDKESPPAPSSVAPKAPASKAGTMSSEWRPVERAVGKTSGRSGSDAIRPEVYFTQSGQRPTSEVKASAQPSTPVSISQWGVSVGIPLSTDGVQATFHGSFWDALTPSGERMTEIGNPQVDVAIPWVRDSAGSRVDFLTSASLPRRGARYHAHNRWDVGAGLGTTRNILGVQAALSGMYVHKRDSANAFYDVGDEVIASISLATALTPDVHMMLEGTYRRAYSLKEDNKTLVTMATLGTVKPIVAVRVAPTVEVSAGGVLRVRASDVRGKEAVFGDPSIEGLLSDQVLGGVRILF